MNANMSLQTQRIEESHLAVGTHVSLVCVRGLVHFLVLEAAEAQLAVITFIWLHAIKSPLGNSSSRILGRRLFNLWRFWWFSPP